MNKILLIIQREYLSRVKKKSFVVMTLLGPLLMAALFLAPVWLSTMEDDSVNNIIVIDKTGKYDDVLISNSKIIFSFSKDESINEIKSKFDSLSFHALLLIPEDETEIIMYSDKQIKSDVIRHIKNEIEIYKENLNFEKIGITPEQITGAKESVRVSTVKWTEEGDRKVMPETGKAIGFIFAMIVYMFIFMYGVQVMRGVIEEKTSRIVEVLVSSVKPFELMAGKIVGIALVALTQFLVWIFLTLAIVTLVLPFFGISGSEMATPNAQIENIDTNIITSNFLPQILNFNWAYFIAIFIVYFLGGYLLYAAMFAAIGAAVDNETDTQQFMMPVTIPLIVAIIAVQGILQNGGGSLAFWFSIIPLTSPIIMPIRVAMEEVDIYSLISSIVVLYASFIGGVWMTGKIYKTGILMYGKKITYKELWKWLKY